jgi:hypothetical protein
VPGPKVLYFCCGITGPQTPESIIWHKLGNARWSGGQIVGQVTQVFQLVMRLFQGELQLRKQSPTVRDSQGHAAYFAQNFVPILLTPDNGVVVQECPARYQSITPAHLACGPTGVTVAQFLDRYRFFFYLWVIRSIIRPKNEIIDMQEGKANPIQFGWTALSQENFIIQKNISVGESRWWGRGKGGKQARVCSLMSLEGGGTVSIWRWAIISGGVEASSSSG